MVLVEEEDWSELDLGLISGPNMLKVEIGGLGGDLGDSMEGLNDGCWCGVWFIEGAM